MTMKASEIALALRDFAGRIASGSREIEPKRSIALLIEAADRLEHSTARGVLTIAYEHAKDHNKPNPLDFAFGAEWLSEQIEIGAMK